MIDPHPEDPDAPHTQEELEAFSAGSDLHTLEECAARLAKSGYRASLMLTIEQIIKEHRLDSLHRIAAE